MATPQPVEGQLAQRRQRRADELGEDLCRFRELIAALGSGERTGRGLSREEAGEALDRILDGRCGDAQIGAFLIAHRIRRPEVQELAGMLDSYRSHGPRLEAIPRRVVSFGVPFDGRVRTAPLLPLTALVLVAADLGVVLQGGDPMPVKYGLTTAEALSALDLDLRQLPWPDVQRTFSDHHLALLHQPRHFPAAERLVPIREQIGKRPPIATLELLWSCYAGPHLQVSGFVHAPTEGLAWGALAATGQDPVLMMKGMEGSVDLPTNRVSIASHRDGGVPERLILRAHDHGLQAREVTLDSLALWRSQALQALQGEGPLLPALLWNAGFLLWRTGVRSCLEEGLFLADRLLREGQVEERRRALADRLRLRTAVAAQDMG